MNATRAKKLTVGDFMTRGVLSVKSTSNVCRAARMMAERNIGSVVVTGEKGPLGVFTERDLLSRVFAMQSSPETTKVSGVLSSIVRVDIAATARQAAEAMLKGKGRLLVKEKGAPTGIFTERDFVRKVYCTGISDANPVGDFVSSPLVTAELGIDGKEAAELMVAKGIKRLPLTSGGDIVGMVTARDLVEALASANIELISQMRVSY